MPFMLDPRDPRWKTNVNDNTDPLAWYLAQTRNTPDDLVDQMSPGMLQNIAKFGVDQFTDPQNLIYNQMGIGSFVLPGAKSLWSAIAGRLGRRAKPVVTEAAPKVAEAAAPFVPKPPSWSNVAVPGKAAPAATIPTVAPTVGKTTSVTRKLGRVAKWGIPATALAGFGLNQYLGGGLPEETPPTQAPQVQTRGGGGSVRAPRPSPQVDYSGLDQILSQPSTQSSPLGRAIAPTVAPPIAPPIQGKSGGVDWMELLKVFGPMLAAVLLSRR